MQLKSVEGYEPGQQLNVEEIFKVGEKVDVAGTTNGKGFQGNPVAPRFNCSEVAALCVHRRRLLRSILLHDTD